MSVTSSSQSTTSHERITGGTKTLDYYIRWNSLHGAHIIGCEERAATSSRRYAQCARRSDSMRYTYLTLLFCGLLSLSCSNTVTGPTNGEDLLSNSTFQISGHPSLAGWSVLDTSVTHFSTDLPKGGSGSSIVMHAAWFAPWPANSIFTTVVPQVGSHQYTLSVFAKDTGAGGSITVYLNRPGSPNLSSAAVLRADDSSWTYYSQTDTITTSPGDTLFVVINGGGTELLPGTTYFNTCRLVEVK
jgi:hypothetical protein